MKIIVSVIVVAFAVILILFCIGLFLPSRKEFVKAAVLKAELGKVFTTVTDFSNQASWRNDVKEIVVIDEVTWTEIPQRGRAITFRVKERIENEVFRIEIIEPQTMNGYWVGHFRSVSPTETSIEFKEVVSIQNPLLRTLSYFFLDLNKTMDIYLHNLKYAVEK